MNLHRITRNAALISSAGSLLLASSAEARTLSFTSPAEGAIRCSLSVNRSLVESIRYRGRTKRYDDRSRERSRCPGTYPVTFSCSPYEPQVRRVRIAQGKGHSHRGELITSLHFARHMPRPSAALPAAATAAPAPLPISASSAAD